MKKDNKHIILDWLDLGNKGTIRDICVATKVCKKSASRIISEFRALGLVKSTAFAEREVGSTGMRPLVWIRTEEEAPAQTRSAPDMTVKFDRKRRRERRPNPVVVENKSIVTRALQKRTLLELHWGQNA